MMTDKHYYGRLKGRVALVFGGGSSEPGWSNGKAAAVLYAREGATVAVVDIDLDAARCQSNGPYGRSVGCGLRSAISS